MLSLSIIVWKSINVFCGGKIQNIRVLKKMVYMVTLGFKSTVLAKCNVYIYIYIYIHYTGDVYRETQPYCSHVG
jgi:hypothetical protein